ncbi:MAG: bifunctional D-glycero-beta-D-manno-heptose-7-phosphate kinase/D-glycero-beta-D-manno-heptose 1-phosphate adenylyltransferase HldE [Pseudomonadota bacterium]
MTLSIPNFAGARVLVAGDIMVDQYWFGQVGRISPEAPVPVVRVRESEHRPGGAGNVAVNLASLGAQASLMGFTGEDDAAAQLAEQLQQRGVNCAFVELEGVPTTTKLRVVSRNQQLIRLDLEEDAAALPEGSLLETFANALAHVDVVILSDYAKGALREAPELIRMCNEADVPVFVDPKGTDFERYRGATALTPNLSEFEAVVGPCADDNAICERGDALRRQLDIDLLLVTRSERGMTLLGLEDGPLHLPAEAREVYDVTGAGDTVIATFAASVAAGAAAGQAAAIANLAAGLVVRKLGVATVTRSEMRLALHQRGIGGRGMIDEERLREFVTEAQARGETVVMTNGCFDIIHAGHVAYLEEAKSLGDRLVVAVNDDASVSRLKGKERPVVPLADRMSVLAGLAAVDWVVPFSEDTPERLICSVLPDMLVKGGDYRPEDIAGAKCVTGNGGQVRVLTFREGRSTSSLIEAIRER